MLQGLKHFPGNPFQYLMQFLNESITAILHFKEIAKSNNEKRRRSLRGCFAYLASGEISRIQNDLNEINEDEEEDDNEKVVDDNSNDEKKSQPLPHNFKKKKKKKRIRRHNKK
jgi:hypothetical protein